MPGGCAAPRCSPTPPWRPGHSASGPRPPPRTAAPSSVSGWRQADDLGQYVGTVLVEEGHGDAVGRHVAWAAPVRIPACPRRGRPGAERAGTESGTRPSVPAAPRADLPSGQRARQGRGPAGARSGHSGRSRPVRTPGPPARRPTLRPPFRARSRVGDPHVVEEDLVEVVGPDHVGDRTHLDRRVGHGHQEDRQALLLLLTLGRAGEEEAPLGHRGVGRPDLLAGDEPPLTVAAGCRLHGSQVGPRIGFAEPLAPDHLAPGDRR